MKILCILLFLALCTGFGFGQTFSKGDSVIPKFPPAAMSFDKAKIFGGIRNLYKINLNKNASGKIIINSSENWENLGFPIMKVYKIKNWETSKNKPAKIELRAEEEELDIFIPNDIDVQDGLSAILFKGSLIEFESSDFFSLQKTRLLPTVFKNEIAVIPPKLQYELIKESQYDMEAFFPAEFKGKVYFGILYFNNVVYNSIQLNSSDRASRITESVLKRMLNTYKKIGKIDNLEGIKIVSDIEYRDFVRESGIKAHVEKFELFTSFDTLQKFKDAEITNQDLVDESIILVDGSRVKVTFSNAK